MRLAGIDCSDGVALKLAGVDLLDQTPIFDIKPYLPYADALHSAEGGFAPENPESAVTVSFTSNAERQLARLAPQRPRLRQLICELLAYDPRPAYRSDNDASRDYGVKLYDLDVRWRMSGDIAEVTALVLQS